MQACGDSSQGMGEFYFSMFNFYIAFCVVGLFNVVTGVFVVSWMHILKICAATTSLARFEGFLTASIPTLP